MKIFSNILSVIFHPLLVPLFAFALLFVFSYLNVMPLPYQLFVLSIVGTFTVLAPGLFIGIYKWINKWNFEELNERKRRFIPYLLTMMSYMTSLITMWKLHFPHYFSGILVSALIAMTICTILNFRWKVSVHLAGCGMYIGGLLSYSLLFYFNPVWWLCGFILLSGIQGTARISYYQHTLLEVILGFMTGMFCGIIGILFI